MTFRHLGRLGRKFEAMRRLARRKAAARKQAERRPRITVLDYEPQPEEIRALHKKHPHGFVFHMSDARTWGWNPAELERQKKVVEEGDYIPAADFFNGLRAKIRARG